MNRKLNLLTMLIFAYSVLVCVTFKKDNPADVLTGINHSMKTNEVVKPLHPEVDKVTASAAHIPNSGQ